MLTIFAVLPSHVTAQVSTPRGVFASIQAGTPIGSSILSNPDVDGISLRNGWDAVNPSEDVYDWSYFDTEIAAARAAGKEVLLRVSDGGLNIPAWVAQASLSAGEPTFSFYERDEFQGGDLVTEPVFWAPTLLAKKKKLMAAFGARYNSNPTVAIVTCQFAGGRNDDWNVPSGTTVDGIPPAGSTETSRWLAAGYTTAKMVDAGNQIVSNAMAAFPDKPIGLAIGRTSLALDPEGKDYVAKTVVDNARARWGDRMVGTKNSVSAKMTPPPPPSDNFWSLLWNCRPGVGGQMLWFTYNDSTYRNNGGVQADPTTVLENAVNLAHGYGLKYLEIYTADILGLPWAVHYAHNLLTAAPSPTPTPSSVNAPSAPRHIAADLNNDGKPDYVLYNASTRGTAVWYLNNNVYIGGTYGPILTAGWRLVDMADFNGTGYRDYVLFNPSTRRTAIWYLSGVTLVGAAYGPTIPSGWTLIASADLNGDGKSDYVLYNASTRRTVVWHMNNNVFLGGNLGPALPTGWGLVGVADFNSDGKTDYLLFNPATRQSAIGYLSGLTFVGGAFGPTIASGYELTGTADFNSDGKPDYLLYNSSTRRTAIWYLNNNTFLGGAFGPILTAGWN
jgi:hypothetical protein